MERRTERSASAPSGSAVPARAATSSDDIGGAIAEVIHDAPESLALWLRAGRVQRGLSLDDVARVTKIQARILERLEAGKLDGLPAEVFVRGFVRSVARCVGLDEREALRRYAACGPGCAISTLGTTSRALVEAIAELAPTSATVARATPRKMLAVEVVESQDGGSGHAVAEKADATPELSAPSALPSTPELSPRITAPMCAVEGDAPSSPDQIDGIEAELDAAALHADPSLPIAAAIAEPVPSSNQGNPGNQGKKKKGRRAKRNKRRALAAEMPVGHAALAPLVKSDAPWAPRMSSPGAPWRRRACATSTSAIIPRLVIDDADPDSAEQVLEERAATQAPRRTFLPPILLDREDRSARQGGLTLAVIILLVAATLTLSYLMRRPGASGDGMTQRGPDRSLPARDPG